MDDRGNFWSDYQGYDLDGDGMGDLPYRAESLFEDLMDREPRLRLFLYSPAQQAIELAARAVPLVKPQPKFSDAAPLMQPVLFRTQWTPSHDPAPMAALAAGLLTLAAGGLLGGMGMRDRAERVFAIRGGER